MTLLCNNVVLSDGKTDFYSFSKMSKVKNLTVDVKIIK